jgi:hypothetical protein
MLFDKNDLVIASCLVWLVVLVALAGAAALLVWLLV